MCRRMFSAVVTLCGFLAAADAPAQVTLEQKFPEGKKSKVLVKVSAKQTLTLNNMPFESGSEQEILISSENGNRDADGKLEQRQKIERLTAKLSLPGGVVLEFDSDKPNQPPPGTQFDVLLELVRATANGSWTVVRGKDNRVLAIEGRDKILESLDESKRELLKRQIDPDYLRDKANRELDKIPSEPLSKGDSWERTETLRLEAAQNLILKTKYTYQGEVDRNGKPLHQIDLNTTEVTYTIEEGAPTPLKLASSHLKPKTLEGVIYFDNEAGEVVESREKIQINGDLKFTVNGNELAGTLDLVMENSTVKQ